MSINVSLTLDAAGTFDSIFGFFFYHQTPSINFYLSVWSVVHDTLRESKGEWIGRGIPPDDDVVRHAPRSSPLDHPSFRGNAAFGAASLDIETPPRSGHDELLRFDTGDHRSWWDYFFGPESLFGAAAGGVDEFEVFSGVKWITRTFNWQRLYPHSFFPSSGLASIRTGTLNSS